MRDGRIIDDVALDGRREAARDAMDRAGML